MEFLGQRFACLNVDTCCQCSAFQRAYAGVDGGHERRCIFLCTCQYLVLPVFSVFDSILVIPLSLLPYIPLCGWLPNAHLQFRGGGELWNSPCVFSYLTSPLRFLVDTFKSACSKLKPSVCLRPPHLLHVHFPLAVNGSSTLPVAQDKNLNAIFDSSFRCHIQSSATPWPKSPSSLTWITGRVP